MAKYLSELVKHMTPESVEAAREQAQQMSAAIRLAELRKQQKTTQKDLAERMRVSQASISQMESQGDMQLSTLLRYVHALGGTLTLQVDMPDGTRVSVLQG